MAAILANPGQADPENVDKITLDEKTVAVPELIIVGGRDSVGGTVKPYNFYKRYHPQGAPWVYLVQNNIPHCWGRPPSLLALHPSTAHRLTVSVLSLATAKQHSGRIGPKSEQTFVDSGLKWNDRLVDSCDWLAARQRARRPLRHRRKLRSRQLFRVCYRRSSKLSKSRRLASMLGGPDLRERNRLPGCIVGRAPAHPRLTIDARCRLLLKPICATRRLPPSGHT